MLQQRLIFRQLVESVSSTYTYIIGCPISREAVIIDPVVDTVKRDVKLINELGLNLRYGLNTHVHADHITGTALLRKAFPDMKSVLSAASEGKADVLVDDNDVLTVGKKKIEVRLTPGHTNGCVTYVVHSDRLAFTGDSLLIRGCGRTDFQQGNAHTLYHSIWSKILTLPEDYSLFVGHNYEGILQTTVEEEKKYNTRLTRNEEDFVNIMNNLNLPYPKQIDKAVPANVMDGEVEVEEKNVDSLYQ